jgi:hypothetical protein
LNSLSGAYGKKCKTDFETLRASVYWAESLARTKRLPDFQNWINPPKPARALKGEEAERRKAEHDADVAMIESLIAKSEQAKSEQGSSVDG